jgi:hypothetical protein
MATISQNQVPLCFMARILPKRSGKGQEYRPHSQGTNPGELRVRLPTKLEPAINPRAADALGLTIPPKLLALADEVIEYNAHFCRWPSADVQGTAE